MDMRLPDSEHTGRPWRIHAIAPDFAVEDVWALPTPGGPGDFRRLVHGFARADEMDSPSRLARLLFALRWKLGELFGWDDDRDGLGGRVASLRDRLPADLRDTPRPGFRKLPFETLYLTDDEWAAEIANSTMHGVLHLGWVPDEATGGYRGQMAVLVKPNGLLGRAYMAAIRPFRHLIVYPSMLRQVGRVWKESRP
jgi:hypothetical protein